MYVDVQIILSQGLLGYTCFTGGLEKPPQEAYILKYNTALYRFKWFFYTYLFGGEGELELLYVHLHFPGYFLRAV